MAKQGKGIFLPKGHTINKGKRAKYNLAQGASVAGAGVGGALLGSGRLLPGMAVIGTSFYSSGKAVDRYTKAAKSQSNPRSSANTRNTPTKVRTNGRVARKG